MSAREPTQVAQEIELKITQEKKEYGMDDWKIGVLIVVTSVVLFLIGWSTYSYCEANAYNSVTGKHVSTGQAMFLQLRVDNSAK